MPDTTGARSRVKGPFSELEKQILAAHAAGNKALLSRLYGEAADNFQNCGDADAEAFFLTHGWIFALDSGAPEASSYEQRLKELGRL